MPPVTPRSRRTRSAAVAVLDLARRDLFEGDRQVVLGGGVDHRRRELLERALAEVVVVGVDLTGALGGDDHARIRRVDVLQEAVDAGGDHAYILERTSRSNSAPARSRRSLTTTSSNSSCAASSSRAVARRASTCSGWSVPRPTSRARSAASDGGLTKIRTAPGTACATCRAPCTSISSTTEPPVTRRRSSSERSVP